MPFEEEIGIHPSLEDMQDLVVTKRSRPCLKESWYTNEVLHELMITKSLVLVKFKLVHPFLMVSSACRATLMYTCWYD